MATNLHVALDEVERRDSEVGEAGAEYPAEGAGDVEQRRVHLYGMTFPLRHPAHRIGFLESAVDGGLPTPPELSDVGGERGQDAVEG
jgi:hypothetical protein